MTYTGGNYRLEDRAAESARAFRASPQLTLEDRKFIVDQALLLLNENYVHLPLKTARLAVDPVQRLRLLRSRIERETPITMSSEWLFHKEMSSIFTSLRDLQTNYLFPPPFAGFIAFLPFALEKYREDGIAHYIVTRIRRGFTSSGFERGVEVTHWNGVPIERAVDNNVAQFAGNNSAANLTRGLESLTLRPLVIQLPPEEDWVIATYVGLDGATHELRVTWQVLANLPTVTELDALSTAALSLGLDLDSDERSRAKKVVYLPNVVALEEGLSSAQLAAAHAVNEGDIATTMPGVFRARTVQTASGMFGHIRIFTFRVEDPVVFRDEFVRLIFALPQNGLILDVRNNGGGNICAAEFTLQTMTPSVVSPEPMQFISSNVNLRICRRHEGNPTGQVNLGPWVRSLDQADEIDQTFSAAFPLTPEDGANDVGQTYAGPIVLVTDGRCYSATEIFAAGFADHSIGKILGIDGNTGGGGANAWTHAQLTSLMQMPAPDPAAPYKPLPGGVNMRVAIRRSVRIGRSAGTPIEDLGVRSDAVHQMTRDDLLNGNADLLDAAAVMLASMPRRRLDVAASLAGGTLTIDLAVENVDRVDLFIDGRPEKSVDLTSSTEVIAIDDVRPDQRLRVEGYQAGTLVASRSLAV